MSKSAGYIIEGMSSQCQFSLKRPIYGKPFEDAHQQGAVEIERSRLTRYISLKKELTLFSPQTRDSLWHTPKDDTGKHVYL